MQGRASRCGLGGGLVALLAAMLWPAQGTAQVAAGAVAPEPADAFGGDPFRSHSWPGLKREFLGSAPARFDPRVQVRGPAIAEDPMNVPITVDARALQQVEQITVVVDRNPIRKVLDYFPLAASPSVSLRFKLEQASAVRALVKTRDGTWHIGGTWVDSAGGGCTVAGVTRKDGSWSSSLGQASGRVFLGGATANGATSFDGARLRVRVMHPMDTGLVGGIPAFYVNRLAVRDERGIQLLRLHSFEPVSENPVFSFDFAQRPAGPLRVVGTDNNGNRIDSRIE